MCDWIIPTSSVVQAACTIVLAVLTGWYACWVRREVRQNREFFDKKAAETKDLVERQAADYRQRDRQQVERAIQTILAELEINRQDGHWEHHKSPSLLHSAYAANLWAVPLAGMSAETFRAVGEAYLWIAAYNDRNAVALDAGRGEGFKTNPALAAWDTAQAAIRKAAEALKAEGVAYCKAETTAKRADPTAGGGG